MSRTNPDSRLALATSHQALADRITAGYGFKNDRGVTTYNPELCKEFKKKHEAIALDYRIMSQEV